MTDGVFLVRLRRGSAVDDIVTVDCRRRTIWDNAEEYPLRLGEEALLLCTGDGEENVSVHEIREVKRD